MKKKLVRIKFVSIFAVFVCIFAMVIIPAEVAAVGNLISGFFSQSGEESHSHSDMTAWESATSLPATAGSYYLTNDVTVSSTWNVPSGTTTLCLNGYGIRMTGDARVISVPGDATLNIVDTSDKTAVHYVTLNNWRGVSVSSTGNESDASSGNGVVKVTGGYITGGLCYDVGCGILVNGVLNMSSGTVLGNRIDASASGAGICVGDNGTVTLSGDTKVIYNKTYDWGGGIATNGTLAIRGSAQVRYNRGQSGIHHTGKALKLSGSPIIDDNSLDASGSGVGIRVERLMTVDGTLEDGARINIALYGMSGAFTNSTDTSYNDSSKFVSERTDCIVIKNSAGQLELVDANTVASVTSGSTEHFYTSLSGAINAWKNGGKLTLFADSSYNSIINMRPMYGYNANRYTLDLNGKTFSIQSVQVGLDNSPNTLRTGPCLTVEDSRTGGVLRLKESGMIDYGGLIELRGGTLTGGNGTWGGLFLLHIYASLDMYDGVTLTGNTSTYGGAVLVGSDSEFNMYGGKICGNYASDSGGGVVVFDNDAARFNMYGGEISGNRSPKGGGVSVNVGSFHICGSAVVIKDNVSDGTYNSETGAFIGTNPNNVYLPSGKVIGIDSELSSASVGVTLQNKTGVFTSGLSGKGTADNFVSDNSSYEVYINNNGEAGIKAKPVASVTVGDSVTEYAAISEAVNAWNNASYGAILTLEDDVTTTSAIDFKGTKTLDLNGHGIRYAGSGKASVLISSAWNNNSASAGLTINDSNPHRLHKITLSGYRGTAAEAVTAAGDTAVDTNGNGTVYVSGGYITGGTGTLLSGSIYIGGALYVRGDTKAVTINGGTFVGNACDFGGMTHCSHGSISVNGGTIIYNKGNGAVFNMDGASRLYLGGGEIAHNTSGVRFATDNGSVLSLGGNNGSAAFVENGEYDIWLASGKLINIGGTLTNTAPIGVTLQNGTGVFTSGLSGKGTAANFTSNNSNYEIRLLNGEAYAGLPHTHSWGYTVNGDTLTATCSGVAGGCCDIESQTLTVSAQGKTYDGTPVTAALTYSDGWKTDNGLSVPEIVYSGNTDAGTYTASVTLGGKTASASFTIDEKPMADEISAAGYSGNYDGEAHTVTVSAPNGATVRYGEEAGVYTLDEAPAYTNAGSHTVYYKVTRKNYAAVTGSLTVTVNRIQAVVTVVGENITADYDGKEHTASGYLAVADTRLFDVTKDIAFDGNDTVSLTDVGKATMNLTAEQFSNTNDNFATVTFLVKDGYVEILLVDAVLLSAPVSTDPVYNASLQELVVAGVADGGECYYALGENPKDAPDEGAYTTALPTKKEIGNYYVWYCVRADKNHNDLPAACVKVTLADTDWVTLEGVLLKNDGITPLGDAVISLVKGNQKVDYVITGDNGAYRFTVPAGIYNFTVQYQQNTETAIVTVFSDKQQNFAIAGGMTESTVEVKDNGDNRFAVVVGGLNEEAISIRKAGGIAEDKNVSVRMSIESKTEDTAVNAGAFSYLSRNKSFMFFDVEIEKTVDSKTTVMNTTANVLEIAVPYEKVNRRGLSVYSSDGSLVRTLTESQSKEEGTFRIDKENGLIYIYSRQFNTFAIGYTPYYKVDSVMSLGSFTGSATVVLTGENGEGVFTLDSADIGNISFADIPKGRYIMTVTWEDGATNTLTMPLAVS